MATDRIEKIKQITKKLKPQATGLEPNKDHFEALMKQRRVSVEETNKGVAENNQKVLANQSEATTKTENNLFDEVRALNQRVEHVTRSSPDELVAQADDVIAQIESVKTKLETPNVELKNSVQTILRNKLTDIDENLKIAMDKAGLEYTPPPKSTSLAAPVDRFLGLLTHSQAQLETIADDVRIMAESNQEYSPANMLLIQIKVSQIQQEIELFTSMLNKALESTKTIMNVQV